MRKNRFTVTDQHLKLIRRMNVGYDDMCEFGAPIIDPKRPYGNSSVFCDIGEILGIEPDNDNQEGSYFSEEQERQMRNLHRGAATALQIALSVGYFKTGEYESDLYSSKWRKI